MQISLMVSMPNCMAVLVVIGMATLVVIGMATLVVGMATLVVGMATLVVGTKRLIRPSVYDSTVVRVQEAIQADDERAGIRRQD